MITIIFGLPRAGKTCLMTHMANTYAFDRQRTKAMHQELLQKMNAGFIGIKTIPQHCVSSNYDITLRKFLCSPRCSRRINPYRLGFSNSYVETHFNIPYEVICITEAQKYLNSRMSMCFPSWQSRWYEQHGHNNLDILLDTQRPELIDVNVRALAGFIEICELNMEYDYFGRPTRLVWEIRRIPNVSLYERYISSGKQDKTCYEEDIVVADYNVFRCYNSRLCKPKFYAGHFDQDIDYFQAEPTEETIEGYIRYLENADDEMPSGFYKSSKGDKAA